MRRRKTASPSARSARVGTEHGATLIELIVVSSVLVVILTMAMVGLSRLTTAFGDSAMRTENLQEGMILLNVMSKDIRTAARDSASSSPFTEATSGSITFYANLNTSSDAERRTVRIYVDTDTQKIFETVTKPGGSPRIRTVGRYVTNDPLSDPIFTYYDIDGNELTVDEAGALDATDWPNVRSVKIELWVRKSTDRSLPSTQVATRVRMPNLDYTATQEGR